MKVGPKLVELWTVAGASIGVPPDPPLAPVLDPPVDGPWLPATPPACTRVVDVPLHGVAFAAALAFARTDGRGLTPLNPKTAAGKPMPLFAGTARDSTAPGQARLEDRTADDSVPTYRVAQGDWFGRWSDWATELGPAKARTPPPRPILEVDYQPPSWTPAAPFTPPSPVPAGGLSGLLSVRVPVPDNTKLPPGANQLASLRVVVTSGGASFSDARYAIPSTTGTPGSSPGVWLVAGTTTASGTLQPVLVVQMNGPALMPSASSVLTVTAYWIDSAGVSSDPSAAPPRQQTIYDPRPPPGPTLPSTLQYTARPDATGRARVELTWAPTGDHYRVFYADENQLALGIAKLANGTAAILTALSPSAKAAVQATATTAQADLSSAPSGAADRAARFLAHANLFDWSMFQNLTASPLRAPSSGNVVFRDEVSGSLRVLSFYRVIAVSANNVAADFASAPLVPVAVPNDGPPARPTLSVKAVAPASTASPSAPGGAELTLHVPLGAVAPVHLRVRRSIVGSDDPRTLRISYEADLPAAGAYPTAPLTSVSTDARATTIVLSED
ncbi:MAG TPA: hypothetical protein VIF09_08395, partial [Polyangiaceae bacterium]